jgi:Arc/MetJ family transcription regulator
MSPVNCVDRYAISTVMRYEVNSSTLVILCVPVTYRVHKVRTNIEIDDKLMKDALRATGAKTKREAVELGLKTLVQLRAQEKARELRGKITWEGDLNAMRTDR